MAYDPTNRGALWKNDKRKNERSPVYTGTINVDGVDYYLNAWPGEKGKPNAPVLKFSVKRKDNPSQSNYAATSQPAPDFDDDIPF